MSIEQNPFILTDHNKRQFAVIEHYRQVLNGKLVDSASLYAGQGNLFDMWVSGGHLSNANIEVSSIERLTYASDTNNMNLRSILLTDRDYHTVVGNVTDSWHCGGGGTRGIFHAGSSTERLTYSNDTGGTTSKGNLPVTSIYIGSSGNRENGWIIGGSSSIIRISYASDDFGSTLRGNMISPPTRIRGVSGNSTDAWAYGGFVSSGSGLKTSSIIQRITYSNDMAIASRKINLSEVKMSTGSAANTTDGWCVGGIKNAQSGPTSLSTVERITFASDTSSISIRGNWVINGGEIAASGNVTDLWGNVGTGSGGSTVRSTVARITYSNDTATATNRSNMTQQKGSVAAAK